MNPKFGNMPAPGVRGSGGGGVPIRGLAGDQTWMFVFSQIMHLVIVMLVLATLLLALRMWVRSRTRPAAGLAELEVLYARGDVKRDDYLARRADLEHTTP